MTTDTQPKIVMEECYIGKSLIKIYGIAKGSGMICPNMATSWLYFYRCRSSNDTLNKLKKEYILLIITCDGDTSTNDMVSIFQLVKLIM